MRPLPARVAMLRTTASLMSVTKWEKFFWVLEHVESIQWCNLKLLGADVTQSATPGFSALYVRGYIDWDQPFDLKWIEWIEFERVAVVRHSKHFPLRVYQQDIDQLVRWLSRIGQFPIEETAGGIRIVGHVV